MKIQKTGEVNKDVMDIFQDQRSRGTQGFGAIFMREDQTFEEYRATGEIKALLDLYMNPSRLIFFHHRTPTSTGNTIDQTHPLLIRSARLKYDYLIAHNGIISNDDEIKKLHERAGFKYRTEYKEKGYYDKWETKWNDSETLAIEVAMYIEKLRKNLRTEGSVAFVAAQIDKKTKKLINIFFGRNHQALTVSIEKDAVTVSSEGQKKEVEPNKLFKLAIATLLVTSEPLIFKERETVVVAENTRYLGTRSYGCQGHYDHTEHKWVYENAKPPTLPKPESYAYYSDDAEIENRIDKAHEEIETELESYYYALGYNYGDTTAESITLRIQNILNTLQADIARRWLEIDAEKANV